LAEGQVVRSIGSKRHCVYNEDESMRDAESPRSLQGSQAQLDQNGSALGATPIAAHEEQACSLDKKRLAKQFRVDAKKKKGQKSTRPEIEDGFQGPGLKVPTPLLVATSKAEAVAPGSEGNQESDRLARQTADAIQGQNHSVEWSSENLFRTPFLK